jgi:hypothetical protein
MIFADKIVLRLVTLGSSFGNCGQCTYLQSLVAVLQVEFCGRFLIALQLLNCWKQSIANIFHFCEVTLDII